MPAPFETLVQELAKLPGVGRRSAERAALSLVRKGAPALAALEDALAAVNEAISRVGIQQAEMHRLPLHLSPNPATGSVTVNTGCGEQQMLQVYGINGRLMMEMPVRTETTIDVSHWTRGLYIVRVGSRIEKLIVY